MSDIPYHAPSVANLVNEFDAMVVASPGTPHVTVVHHEGQADMIDTAIVNAGLRIERIDSTRVKVFEGDRR